jgi:hypothetical protein
VSEDHLHGKVGELPVEIGKLVHVHQEFYVPAEWLDARSESLQLFERENTFVELEIDDVAADAAHAKPM